MIGTKLSSTETIATTASAHPTAMAEQEPATGSDFRIDAELELALELDSLLQQDGNVLIVAPRTSLRWLGETIRQEAEYAAGGNVAMLHWPEQTGPVPILASTLLEDPNRGLKKSLLTADVLIINDLITFLRLFPARIYALLACRLEAGRRNILLTSYERWQLLAELEYRPQPSVVERLDLAGTVPAGRYVDRSWRYSMPMRHVLERLGVGIFIDGKASSTPLYDRIAIPPGEVARELVTRLKFLPMNWAVNGDVAACRCVIEPTPTWQTHCL